MRQSLAGIEICCISRNGYGNDHKVSDRQVWENTVDPDQTAPKGAEQSDQGLHCLPFTLNILQPLHITLFKF